MKIKKVSIVGTGIMGKGLAHSFALNGYQVCLWGRKKASEINNEVSGYLKNEQQKGRITDSEFEHIKSNIDIKSLSGANDFSEAELVIESVIEDKTEKMKILKSISEHCRPETIITSNTSTLSLEDLSQAVRFNESFLGSHFFSPVPYNNLVEVAKTRYTSDVAMHTVLDVIKSLQKTPFVVQGTPGFVYNRMLLCTLNEAVHLLETQQDAVPDIIDSIFCMGWGMKYGPLKLIDLIGLDTILNCLNNLYKYTGSDKYLASQLLIDYVQQGRLGKKSGKGFYSYIVHVNS